jgi:prepilin-type N-terminal cleavage/methylation domain-containing protein
MKTRSQSAFTLIEMLVVISIIAVLAAFAVPALTSALTKGQMTGTLNNGRQLYLAGQQMALDGAANSDPNLTWPGDDLNANLDLTGYASKLTQNDYLKIGDVAKLFSAPGATCTATSDGNTPPGVVLGGTAGFKVYKVKDADSSNTILLVTANYTYDTVFGANPPSPFGDKGFIVQRKGGDASILRKNNAVVAAGQDAVFQSTVGKKPGDPDGGPVSPGDPAGFMHFP